MTTVLSRSPDEEVRRAGVAALHAGEEELRLLVEALGDDSWRVRKEAVLCAARWEDRDAAAEALVQALADADNVGRRNAAIEGLARIGAPAVAPLLAALSSLPGQRKVIADALGLIGDRRASAALLPLLDDRDGNVRVAAAESLGRIGGPAAEAALRRALAQDDLLLSIAAVEALNRLGAKLALAELAPLLAVPVQRPSVLAAVGLCGDPSAASVLIGCLGDPSRGVREAVWVALSRLAGSLDETGRAEVAGVAAEIGEEGRQELVEALLEAPPAIRRAAACVLGMCGSPSAVRPLLLALRDFEVEEAAERAISALGAEAVEALVALASEPGSPHRLAIFRLLPSLPAAGDARVREMLELAVSDPDPEVAAEAGRALGFVGGRESVGPLLHALGRDDLAAAAAEALAALSLRLPGEVRHAVLSRGFEGAEARHLCRVLGACGRAEDATVLERVLSHRLAPLRAAAVEALAELAGESCFDVLAGAVSDPSPEVRAAAARAIAGWPAGREALAAREPLELDPLVRAVIAAVRDRPG